MDFVERFDFDSFFKEKYSEKIANGIDKYSLLNI